MLFIILLLLLIITGVITGIVYIMKQKLKSRSDSVDDFLREYYPATIQEVQEKISKELEILEKLDGNMEKEKAEPIMNWAQGKSKKVD